MMPVEEVNRVSNVIIGDAIEVHRVLGPGLLESAYQRCLAWELRRHGLLVDEQVGLSIFYKELEIPAAYRLDMLVAGEIIVELKSIDRFEPIHTAQLLTYLKMTGFRLGLLLNFKVEAMRNGIRRIVNNL
jgi:GxxExxY protein